MTFKNILALLFILPVLMLNTGCATAVIAGAAAAGGYIAHEEGYRLKNPITKEEGSADKDNSQYF